MRPGMLDRIITIKKETDGVDSSGGAVKVWSDLANIWASKRDTRGKEYLAAGAERSESTAIFTIRYRSDLTAKGNRIIYDDGIYNIVNLAEIGRREGLEITAVKVA